MKKEETNLNEHIDDHMIKIEVNLDDISSEWLGYVMEKLFEAGARDVYYIPIFMKKNRPGYMLQLLCNQHQLATIKEIIFQETTTFGIRYYPLTVHRLERYFVKLKSPWGEISIKKGILQGETVHCAPEYDDCKRIAELEGIPLKHVYQYVWDHLNNDI